METRRLLLGLLVGLLLVAAFTTERAYRYQLRTGCVTACVAAPRFDPCVARCDR